MAKDKKSKAEAGMMPATAAMMAASPVAMQAWLEVFSESARFISDRMQQDLETQRAMLACKSPAELMQVQAEFYKAAMDQYAREAARLYEMMAKATQGSLREAGAPSSRGYDDVPL